MNEEKNICQQLYNFIISPIKEELSLVERMERISISLKQFVRNETHSFSNPSKANLRSVLVELHRIRLFLGDMVSKPTPAVFY
jgi:hypothetical protein